MQDDAARFSRGVLADMGVDRAAQQIASALRAPKKLDQSSAFVGLTVLCDENAIHIGDGRACIEALRKLSRAASDPAITIGAEKVDILARAAMNASRESSDSSSTESRRAIRKSLDGLLKAGKETALLLQVQAELVAMDSTDDTGQSTMLVERAVAVEPGSGEAKVNLARHYMEQERFSEAIAQLEAAIPLLPAYKRTPAKFNLVRALRADGQVERAAELEKEIALGEASDGQ